MTHQPNISTHASTDVLVIGAGPTGLTTAIELARREVNVRIIERRAQPSTRSKALVVHARTLELMDILGVADDMVKQGYTSPGIDFSASVKNPLRARMYGLDTRFPFILVLPQAKTEEILERRLNGLGIKVARDHKLISFEETASGVVSTIENEEGNSFSIESQYLVGADGSRSTVRQQLGIPFEGASYNWTAFLGDVHIEGHHAEGGTEQHSNDRGLAFIVPFDDGSHRIVTVDRKYQDDNKKRELSLAELQESISAILEKPVELSEPIWLTRWGASLKLASQYRVGRVLMGGDAVHTHSPAGGQGLNTGVQDAFNLGWKLAFVVKGQAPDSLLDTYHSERHPIGKKVLKTSDLLLRSLLLRQPVLRMIREALFRLLIPLPAVQKQLTLNLSGLGIQYETGKGELAGTRIPDMSLMSATHQTFRLYELLRFSGYTLLLFIDPSQPQKARLYKRLIERILVETDNNLQIQVILNNGLPELHDFGANTLVDYKGELETRLGAATGRALLIRPDGYVAVDEPGIEEVVMVEHLQEWTRKPLPVQQLVAV